MQIAENTLGLHMDLVDYTLHLADDALILGHRNSEWTGHGPILEQDIAISNIALDLLGQARNFYQYAAKLLNEKGNSNITEDTLAYLRTEKDFKNCLLVEQTNGDWAKTILRQFFFSAYQFLLYQQLENSPNVTLAAIAEKSLKEVTYHLRWASEWVIRLGDGTEESHSRMVNAKEELWGFVEELFQPAAYESRAFSAGYGVDVMLLKNEWMSKTKNIFDQATLTIPQGRKTETGAKTGGHSENLKNILEEMQYLQRTYPNCEW